MLAENAVSASYKHGNLLGAIEASIAKLGKVPEQLTIEDLGPVDEFHIGGRAATDRFIGQLNFSAQDHVLDIGCGLGGAARYVAKTYDSKVTGVDLTPEYVETGNVLSRWVNLDSKVNLLTGSAMAIPAEDKSFSGAYMLHVGMNIADKAALFREVSRVLKPGSFYGIYDVMRCDDGELTYPVPWASQSSTSVLATAEQYRAALEQAGFKVLSEENRRDFALEFFKSMREKMAAAGGPPPLGLHTLMQESAPTKLTNVASGIAAGLIAPVEMIVRKA